VPPGTPASSSEGNFVAFNRRFDPTHRALFDAIRAGEIGRPEMRVLLPIDRVGATSVSAPR
jgi:hypothetical protein